MDTVIEMPMIPRGEYVVGIGDMFSGVTFAESQIFTIPTVLLGDDHEACMKMSEYCDQATGPWFFFDTTSPGNPDNVFTECNLIESTEGATYSGGSYPGASLYCPTDKRGYLESIAADYSETRVRTTFPSCAAPSRTLPSFEYLGRTIAYGEAVPVTSSMDDSLKLNCPGATKRARCVFVVPQDYSILYNTPQGAEEKYYCHNAAQSIRIPEGIRKISVWRVVRVTCSVGAEGLGDYDYVEAKLVVFGEIGVNRHARTNISMCQPKGNMKAPFRVDSMWWTHPEDSVVHHGSLNELSRNDYACHAKISAKLCVLYWRHVAQISSIEAMKHTTSSKVPTTSDITTNALTTSTCKCTSMQPSHAIKPMLSRHLIFPLAFSAMNI